MKEQIVEMSGLSPRVIRVWFQNRRCKDKKNQMKLEMQLDKVHYIHQHVQSIGHCPNTGLPLLIIQFPNN